MPFIAEGVLRVIVPWSSIHLQRMIKACTGAKIVMETCARVNSP